MGCTAFHAGEAAYSSPHGSATVHVGQDVPMSALAAAARAIAVELRKKEAAQVEAARPRVDTEVTT